MWGMGLICTPFKETKAILHFSYDKEKNKRRRKKRNITV